MAVYDDKKTYTPGDHDNLGTSAGDRAKEIADLEAAYNDTPKDDQPEDKSKLGSGFTDEETPPNPKKTPFWRRRSSVLIGAGAGISLGSVAALFLLFMATLQIPNLSENITRYAMAGVVYESSRSSRRVVSESLGIQSLKDKTKQYFEDRYAGLRSKTFGKMDGYRPSKIAENLGQKADFKPNYGLTKLGKTYIKSFDVNGKTIEVRQVSGVPRFIPGVKDILRITNETKAASQVMTELRSTPGISDRGLLLRSKALKSLRVKHGLSTTAYKLADYKDLPKRLKELNEEIKKSGNKKLFTKQQLQKMIDTKGRYSTVVASTQLSPVATTPKTQGLEETARKVEAATAEAVEKPNELRAMVENNSPAETAMVALEEGSSKYESTFTKTLGLVNGYYGIALPLCLIFDGSMVSAGSTIDKRANALMQTYSDISSKADMQKEGLKSGDDPVAFASAVAGLNDVLGNTSNSNAVLRASGKPIDDTNNSSPETNLMDTYDQSMITAIGKFTAMPQSIINLLNGVVEDACGILTSTEFIVGGTIVSIASAFFTAGESKVAEVAISTAGKNILTRQIKIMVNNMIVKKLKEKGLSTLEYKQMSRMGKIMFGGKGLGSAAKKFGVDSVKFGAKIGALTLVARLIVSKSSNVEFNGLAQGIDLANQADMGGKLLAYETSRTVNAGRALTVKESISAQTEALAYNSTMDQKGSFRERFFSPYNPSSLVAKLSIKMNNLKSEGPSQFVAAIGSVLNPVQLALSSTSSYAQEGVLAAASSPIAYEYGIVPFGWTKQELDQMDKSTYGVNENELVLEKSGKLEEINKIYGPCFSMDEEPTTLGTLLTDEQYLSRNDNGEIVANSDGVCSPKNLSYKNPRFKDLVFRFRLSKLYNSSIDRLSEAQAGAEDKAQLNNQPIQEQL